jgi:hypothetical protein
MPKHHSPRIASGTISLKKKSREPYGNKLQGNGSLNWYARSIVECDCTGKIDNHLAIRDSQSPIRLTYRYGTLSRAAIPSTLVRQSRFPYYNPVQKTGGQMELKPPH